MDDATRTAAEVLGKGTYTAAQILASHPDSWEADQIRRRQVSEIVRGAWDLQCTPDHILAWLTEHRYGWTISRARRDGRDGVVVNLLWVEPGGRGARDQHEAPTLHAALTAAVLAVAERGAGTVGAS